MMQQITSSLPMISNFIIDNLNKLAHQMQIFTTLIIEIALKILKTLSGVYDAHSQQNGQEKNRVANLVEGKSVVIQNPVSQSQLVDNPTQNEETHLFESKSVVVQTPLVTTSRLDIKLPLSTKERLACKTRNRAGLLSNRKYGNPTKTPRKIVQAE